MEKITNTLKKDWLIILLILSSFILGVYFYPVLPDKIPNHWNIKGQVDGYTDRFFGTFGIPLLNLGMYLLFLVLPFIDPKRRNYGNFLSTYKFLRYLMHIFFIGLQVFSMLSALGYIVNSNMFILISISLLFMLMGNVLGRVKHNYFIGIKTPWTLASEEVWKKTHRLAAPLWVAGGAIGILLAFMDPGFGGKAFFIIIMIIVFIPTIYSYIAFRQIMNGSK